MGTRRGLLPGRFLPWKWVPFTALAGVETQDSFPAIGDPGGQASSRPACSKIQAIPVRKSSA